MCRFFGNTFSPYLNFLTLKKINLIINKSAKVWYLPYLEGVYHTGRIEIFANANARMVHIMHFIRTHTNATEMFCFWKLNKKENNNFLEVNK